MKRVHVLLILLALTIFVGVRHYFSLPHVVDRVRSSVVYVEVQSESGNYWSGSGVVIGDGLILTARHVIEDANSIVVVFDDGFRIKTPEYFISKDLGVADVGLIVVGPNITKDYALFAFNVSIEVGAEVFAVGSPFGDINSLSAGNFSAHNRIIEGERLHRIDISGAPGSSGCPVFNRSGSVVGIVVRGNAYGTMFIVPLEVCEAVVGIYENVQKAQETN